jgi:hypothetical protein
MEQRDEQRGNDRQAAQDPDERRSTHGSTSTWKLGLQAQRF